MVPAASVGPQGGCSAAMLVGLTGSCIDIVAAVAAAGGVTQETDRLNVLLPAVPAGVTAIIGPGDGFPFPFPAAAAAAVAAEEARLLVQPALKATCCPPAP